MDWITILLMAISLLAGIIATIAFYWPAIKIMRAVDKGKNHLLLPSRDNPRIFAAAMEIAIGEAEIKEKSLPPKSRPTLSVVKEEK